MVRMVTLIGVLCGRKFVSPHKKAKRGPTFGGNADARIKSFQESQDFMKKHLLN